VADLDEVDHDRANPGSPALDAELPQSHSFIVKFWLEEVIRETGQSVWRGHVTHVPSGRRRFVREPSEVPAFINPYLASIAGERLPPGESAR
jgi:hypothetical protein